MSFIVFEELFEIPLRNGLTKPKRIRGEGYKMVNMGELFAYPRINNLVMDRAPLNEKEKESSLLKTGDLLFARQSLVREGAGQCSIFLNDQEEVCFESHLIRCRLKQDIANPTFYFYFFSSCLGKKIINTIVEQGAGAAGIRGSDLAKLIVPKPSIVIQERIAKILSDLDDKIYLNNQINQTLESIAQAIFKSWFIDFEPVRAKIAAKQEGKDPERAAMCAISGKTQTELEQMAKEDFAELQATAALFPDELVESELGEVPRGWSSVSIGSLIDLTIGGDWGKDVKDEKYKVQARVIRGTDIPSIKIGLDEQVPTRYIESKKLRTRELKLGDIVIEVSGGSPKQPTGRTIYISNEILLRLKDPVIPASFCRLLRPNSHELGVFLSIYLQKIYVEGKTWLYQNQSTGISNFQTTVFLEKEILTLPPLILLEEFEKIITPIIKKIDSSERLFLSNLRDSLLPKLLSGEVDMLLLQQEGA